MAMNAALQAHLDSGVTTLCRCWTLVRTDGLSYGFTDHDRALSFDGVTFLPDSGMAAVAIQSGTGLSVDNTEAIGALSDAALTEADIQAGRFDGAEVTSYLVNWSDVAQRTVLFRGTIGEVRRGAGAFQAELRGLAEALNQPLGRVYQGPCSAVLGDAACGFDPDQPGFHVEVAVGTVESQSAFGFTGMTAFADRWFEKGRLRVLTGEAAGLVALIKNDRESGAARRVEIWERPGAEIRSGDMVRLEAGCDKRAETCRAKFNNFINFRGFPHIPGEDWMMAFPALGGSNSGGSLLG